MSSESKVEEVQLTIRCALQNFDDKNVKCSLDWTVLELKQYLQDNCPTKPEAQHQRLIYAGYCLDNEKTLRSVLRNANLNDGSSGDVQEKQVIHLVCSNKDAAFPPPNRELRHRHKAASSPANSLPNQQTATHSQQQMSFAQYPFGNMQNFYPSMNTQDAYMASYQNYVNQAMLHYQQQLYAAGGHPMMYNPNFSAMTFGMMPQAGGQFFAAQPDLNAAGFGMNAQIPDQQNVGVPIVDARPMAPGGGNNEMRAEDNRPDILDLAYKTIRFCLLVMVLYLYSSVERFAAVLLMIGFIWFVQMRRERQNRNELQQQQQRREQPPVNNAPLLDEQVQEDIDNNNVPNDDNNNNALTPNRAATPIGAAPTNANESAWSVFWSTVSSFFTSLIPENPVPVNVN